MQRTLTTGSMGTGGLGQFPQQGNGKRATGASPTRDKDKEDDELGGYKYIPTASETNSGASGLPTPMNRGIRSQLAAVLYDALFAASISTFVSGKGQRKRPSRLGLVTNTAHPQRRP